jgi:organic radical activating enzyme
MKYKLLVLTKWGDLKVTNHKALADAGMNSYLGWHCELFRHTTNLNSQTGEIRYTSCGNETEVCTVGLCPCATDMLIPKSSNIENLEILRANAESYDGMPDEWSASDGMPLALGATDLLKNECFVVDWFLLRRCNYDCTYCGPMVHDDFSEYPTLATIKKQLDDIPFPKDKKVFFVLSGGEPTIHPNILEIIDMCSDVGEIEMLTNGTASITKYSKILKKARITVSMHHDYINEKWLEKWLRVAEATKGSDSHITFKHFNLFDDVKYKPYLDTLKSYDHIGFVSNLRLVLNKSDVKENDIYVKTYMS